ncbi:MULTISPECIES: hypothetical protein [Paenibacillus]|uniref:CTLH domain-containing protein n=1 Tax=Paenibacillus vandeheii TaxID=3035917 RepID=A0ABT8JHW3_9BACL|nr:MULTISPECIES: hypothetical protein [Paenibacillus]KGP77462.1 hypothetical protein P363_0133310 [Paenibacillus sp. MAEPY1]KGP78423.1 hypothetical protein P364_0128705 [Paenibacillus sp. MAEPY2]MDN4604022.1 hypothetical protein [Paenibacillus vandeheii]
MTDTNEQHNSTTANQSRNIEEVGPSEEIKSYFEQSDILYKYVNHEKFEMVSTDILQLDRTARYSTSKVAEILKSYDFLKSPTGDHQIDDARLRWWLNAKREDNLIDYLNVQKTGNTWTWDVYAIIRAKIVATLRYCNKYSQKDIKVMTTGISTVSAARMSPDTIVSMINSGEIYNISSLDTLKSAFLAYIDHNEKRFESDIAEGIEFIGEQFKEISEEHKVQLEKQGELSVTQERLVQEQEKLASQQAELDERTTKQQELIQRNLDLEFKLKQQQMKRLLRLEAIEQWKSRGALKNLFASEKDKEAFIQSYIDNGLKEFPLNESAATLESGNE